MTSEETNTADSRTLSLPDWESLILERIDEVLFSVDRTWRFTYLNRQASVLWGRSRESLLGQNLWEAFPTLLGTSFEEVYRQAMATNMPNQFEALSPVTHLWYEVRAYPAPQGLIIAFHDITLRKQIEAARQQQAERVRVQAEVADALAEVPHDYHTTLATAARQLAHSIGDICSIRLVSHDAQWSDFVVSDLPDPADAAYMRAVLAADQHQPITGSVAGRTAQTGQPILMPVISSERLKEMIDSKYASYLNRFPIFSVLIVPLRAEGRVIGVIEMNRIRPDLPYTNDDKLVLQGLADRVALAITNARLLQQAQHELAERVRTEAALRVSEARFKALSEASYEALFIHENGLIIDANQRTAELHGYARDELIDKSVYQFIAPESLPALQERLANHEEFSVELIALRKDGSRFIAESRGKPLDYQGRRVRLVAMRDVTDLKQAEATVRATQAQLLQSQKMESVGQLAGGIAHDFNNLLNVMLGFCQLVMSGVPETDPMYADLREIQHAGDRAATLVRQLLAFSRKQVLTPQFVDLNATVANLDTLLRRVLGVEILLQTLLAPDLTLVLVDVGQIEQVIVNIAINARDAMPDGGHLIIETANVHLDEAYQAAGHPEVQPGAYVRLGMRDTGSGMDHDTQAKIFEPFFTTKEQGKGTGLGLATAYGIVQQSAGSITVESELGVGTAFTIYLPSIIE